MEALLAFAAALLAFRFAGDLAGRFRARRAPELAAWSASHGGVRAAAVERALAGLTAGR